MKAAAAAMATAARRHRPIRGPRHFVSRSLIAPTEQAAHQHRQKRQHGVESAGLEIESAYLREIAVEPTEEDPCDVAVAKIADRYGPDFTAPHDASPGHDRFARDWVLYVSCDRQAGLNCRQFFARYPRMFRWKIASREKPDCACHQSNQCAHPER